MAIKGGLKKVVKLEYWGFAKKLICGIIYKKIAIQYDNLQKKCDSLQFANMALCLICIILKEIQKSNTFRLCFTCEQGSHIGCRPGPIIKQNELII